MLESRPYYIHYFRPPHRLLKIDAELLYMDDEVIVTSHILQGASKALVIGGETVIENGYRAVFAEYRKEWFDVAKVFRPVGTFTGYYADINTPSELVDDGYKTKDLFLDLWVSSDRSSITVLDEDEFEDALRNGWITQGEANRAREELVKLIKLFDKGEFPPDILDRYT